MRSMYRIHINLKNSGYLFFLMWSLLLPFQGCGQSRKDSERTVEDILKNHAEDEWNRTIPGSFSAQAKAAFDSMEISRFFKQYPLFYKYEKSIRTFYSHRKMAFAWFDKDGLIEQAGNLTDRAMNLKNEGVNKELPYYQSLDSLIYNGNPGQLADTLKVKLELMLTAQYFAFADLVWEGMDPKVSNEVNWYLPRKKVSYEEYLDSILEAKPGQLKAEKLPVYRQYDLLRTYLLKYRELDEKANWFKIKAGNRVFHPGDSSGLITQVRQRLSDLGDLKGDVRSQVYDEDLEEAVKQFQFRHGLKDDGLLAKATFTELNVPYQQRVKQLLVNMERSRWLPVSLSSDYLVVNIPEFKLHVYSADNLLWSCNVVVGKTMHKTVIFSGELKYIVFSPYWNVPPSIVRNEVLKDMRKDENYLNKHHMEITGYRDGLPEIRQKPGPWNSLGLVKFLFPNSYNIYLHDTPGKSLFNESSRAFSHGCIRISEPFKLAQFLLRDNPAWDDDKIIAAMNAGQEKFVPLKEKVPVFIAYFTAFVDRQGRINFRKDIYERDERLADMMVND